MKILYISGSKFPSEVSHTLSKMRMCQALADEDHEVMLLGMRSEQHQVDPMQYYGLRGGFQVRLWKPAFPLDVLSRYSRVLSKIAFASHVRRVLHEVKPDLVYSRLTTTELLFVPSSIPIIFEMHSLGPLGKSRLQRWWFRSLLARKKVDRVVVTTNALADLLAEQLPDCKTTLARLSAEPPLAISDEDQTAFNEGYRKAEGFSSHVGYTGYLDTIGLRGTDIICRVAAQMPEVAFHIVGGEKSVVEHWQDFARAYNVNGNIFFYGHRNPSEIPLFLGSFDVVLAPLQYRPSARAPIGANMSPLKLPQYMAYRKAIIASDIPSHREILEDGSTALLVQCDDTDAWVTAINKLLADSVLRERIGDAGYQAYLREFTPGGRVRTVLQGLDAGHG